MRFNAVAASHLGNRPHNEDTWLVTNNLLVVADGVGGGPAGKEAADLAARIMRDFVNPSSESLQQSLIDATEIAHHAIIEQGRLDSRKHGMACTLDAAVIQADGTVAGVHVG